jgi:hypothetical protein
MPCAFRIRGACRTFMLDVAIALIGVYALFSLIASHIVERFGAPLNRRGENLYSGIDVYAGLP